MPLLDPRHIQALTPTVVGTKKLARRPEPETDVEDGGGGSGRAGKSRSPGSGEVIKFVKGSSGEVVGEEVRVGKGAGAKRANKREAAEMLGPNAAEQLAVATAKVRVSDQTTDEDGESKRAMKREAAEMLGADAADQLAAATAKVRVSDDAEEEVTGSRQKDASAAGTSTGEAGTAEGETPPAGSDKTGGSMPGGSEAVAEQDRDGGSLSKQSKDTKSDEDGQGTPQGTEVGTGMKSMKGEALAQGEGAKRNDGNYVNVGSSDAGNAEDEAVETEGGEGSTVGKELGTPRDQVRRVSSRSIGEERPERADVTVGGGDGGDDKGSTEPVEKSGQEKGDVAGEGGHGGVGTDTARRGQEGEGSTGLLAEEAVEAEGGVAEDADAETKGQSPEEDEDAGGDGETERVDVGAWAAAAPADRSSILMVLHVDALEVSPGALCQLFGVYGDVMKVRGTSIEMVMSSAVRSPPIPGFD